MSNEKTAAGDPRIGRYRLLRKIGQGGMGAVYEAEHPMLRARVAIKVLPDEYSAHPVARSRFEQEMRAVGQIRHPGVVAAMDADEADGRLFLVMELVEGIDLSKLLSQSEASAGGPVALAAACELMRQAAGAMAFVHDSGLIHRDLKPENLIVDWRGTVKILDLGLARIEESTPSSGLTRVGEFMGSVDFMAPEQASDAQAVDARADIYALGATLYRCVTGRLPFPHEHYGTIAQKVAALITSAPQPAAELRPDAPAELIAIIDAAMTSSPEDRSITAAEMQQRLAAIGADLGDGPAEIKSLLKAARAKRREETPSSGRSTARPQASVSTDLELAAAAGTLPPEFGNLPSTPSADVKKPGPSEESTDRPKSTERRRRDLRRGSGRRRRRSPFPLVAALVAAVACLGLFGFLIADRLPFFDPDVQPVVVEPDGVNDEPGSADQGTVEAEPTEAAPTTEPILASDEPLTVDLQPGPDPATETPLEVLIAADPHTPSGDGAEKSGESAMRPDSGMVDIAASDTSTGSNTTIEMTEPIESPASDEPLDVAFAVDPADLQPLTPTFAPDPEPDPRDIARRERLEELSRRPIDVVLSDYTDPRPEIERQLTSAEESLRAEDVATAAPIFDRVLADSASSKEQRARALLGRGAIRQDAENFDAAEADYATVFKAKSLPPALRAEAYFRVGLVREQVEPGQGLMVFEAIIDNKEATKKTRIKAVYGRGRSRQVRGEIDPALADYAAVIHSDDAEPVHRAQSYYNRALIRENQSESAAAEADYTAALAVDGVPASTIAMAAYNRGWVRHRGQRLSAAVEDYNRVIDLSDPPAEQKARALNNRAAILFSRGDKPGACRDFRAAESLAVANDLDVIAAHAKKAAKQIGCPE